MTITQRFTQARNDRSARRAVQTKHTQLTRDLAVYRTPADRMELELLAANSTNPEAKQVLDILGSMAAAEQRVAARNAA